MKFACAVMAVACFAVAPALSQDYNADPNFGTLNLTTGFRPDPQIVAVRSGGAINAATIANTCAGFISSAPDIRLNYTAGSLPLIISVAADTDTSLVVNGPDGSWYCDDDSGVNGLNPMVRFNQPASGQYDIWIGTVGSNELHPARLYVSELTSQ
jgi:hypothetical protein